MLQSWWDTAIRWFLDVHRAAYAELGGHIQTMDESHTAAALAVVFAFALGVLHALTPGHGKAIVFSYFLGQAARPWAGVAMALKLAATHVGSAAALVLVVGAAAMSLGRPAGVALTLQTVSHIAIAAVGAWLLYRAIRAPSLVPAGAHHEHRRPAGGVLPFAVGLLPCPMTMLILTYAAANATLLGGLALTGVMGLGVAATITLVGMLAILARRSALRWLDPQAGWYVKLCRTLEIGSAAVIFSAGLWMLFGSSAVVSPRPFG